MRVVCPYAGDGPHPDTRAALDCWPDVDFVDLGGDETAYSRLVCELWQGGGEFCLVEHDVVVHPWTLAEFAACPEPLCASPYVWLTNIGPALGCNRFSAALLRAYPDAARKAAEIPGCYGRGSWREFDYWLMRTVLEEEHGQVPHLHLPPVQHLNPAKQLDPKFAHLTLAEQLAKVGYRVNDDGRSATWVGRPRRSVRPKDYD